MIGGELASTLYSTCSSGAPPAFPLYDSATRSPVPVIMITNEFPAAHPARPTISSTTGPMSGVRWSDPAAPTLVHTGGFHVTADVVLDLDVMFPLDVVNVDASSAASPSIVRVVALVETSSTWNCTVAFRMLAPCGTPTPLKRIPTA